MRSAVARTAELRERHVGRIDLFLGDGMGAGIGDQLQRVRRDDAVILRVRTFHPLASDPALVIDLCSTLPAAVETTRPETGTEVGS